MGQARAGELADRFVLPRPRRRAGQALPCEPLPDAHDRAQVSGQPARLSLVSSRRDEARLVGLAWGGFEEARSASVSDGAAIKCARWVAAELFMTNIVAQCHQPIWRHVWRV